MSKKLEEYVKKNNLPEVVEKALIRWVDEHRGKIGDPAVSGIGVIVDETGRTSDTRLIKSPNGLAVYYDMDTKQQVGTAVYMRKCKAVHVKAYEIM